MATTEIAHTSTVERHGLSDAKRKLLAQYLSSRPLAAPAEQRLARRPSTGPAPLSHAQEQIWLHAEMTGDAPFYNETMTVYRHGPLDPAVLQRCVLEIVRRHEIWRTTFELIDGHPVQIVHPVPAEFPLPFVDLSKATQKDREEQAVRLATDDARRPFDLGNGPLLRALLIRVGDDEYRLYMTVHQIVFDAVTAYRVFLPELATLYEAFFNNRPSSLPDVEIQYADYAYWQRHEEEPRGGSDQLSYWRAQLSGELPTLQMPADHPRPPVDTHRGAVERFSFAPDVVALIKKISHESGVSPYMTLVAAFVAMLHRYTGQDDIVLGCFTAGRKHAELEMLLGYFVNPLALRFDVSGSPTFRELQQRVKGVLLDALAHAEVPFAHVVKEKHQKLDPARNPIFQVVLSQQPKLDDRCAGWDLKTEEISNGGSKLDLMIVVDDRGDEIFGPITFNPDLFEAATIKCMIGHWQTLLRSVAADPDQPIASATLLTPQEQHQILIEWNDTSREYPQNACLPDLFEAQTARMPDATAVAFGQNSLTYRELNCRSNQLAHHLRALGVGPEVLVGVCADRSIDMVIALLGTMKAGGAYVPLDPAYPQARLEFMIQDSGLRVLVTGGELNDAARSFDGPLVRLDRDWPQIAAHGSDNPVRQAKPDNLAYVIYTSGSTGRPKGVQIPQRALVNFLSSVREQPGLEDNDRLLAVTTISFDIAGLELYLPLVTGACCVIADRDTAIDGRQLWNMLDAHEITAMQATPSTWKLLLAAGWKGRRNLKALCGGEAMPRELAEQLIPRVGSLWNMYGPTETTIWSAIHKIESCERAIAIGRPLANTTMYILDANMQPVPVGGIGELYIGGHGVARGYLGRPQLTTEKFVSNPFSTNREDRLYRTGDLARYRNGIIECLGRTDNQIKIRGFRIELQEIESVLREHPAVRDACAVVREDIPGDPRLVGYFVRSPERLVSNDELRAVLKQKLPSYMVPVLTELKELPLLPNGKLDRHALPAAQGSTSDHQLSEAEPMDPIEETLARIWSEALKVDQVSTFDNFFDLGGYSLLAAQVVARVCKALGVRIKPKDLAFQTLGQLAASCRERMQLQ